MMKPEFLTRYLMFSLFGLFFIPWFFLLVAMVVTYAFAAKGGYIIGGIAFIFFAWPFYIVTRGSYRRVKFEFSNLNFLRQTLNQNAFIKQPAKVDVFASLTTSRGQRLEFVVFKSPEALTQKKYSILFTSPKSWATNYENVTPLDGEIYLVNDQPILFQKDQFRFWLDARTPNDKADTQLGKKYEKLSDRIEDIRVRGKF